MIAELAMVLLAAAGGQWDYERSGGFSDPGPYDSAARIGDVVVVGGRMGVWRRRVSSLELVVSCPAQEDRPNRVRGWDERGFIASTPCGLYRIDVDGGVTRITHPPEPGALDADGSGRAVVASGSDLWLFQAGGRRRLGYALSGSPGKLEIRGDWLVAEGERRWLLGLSGFHQEELSGWGMHSLPGRDRLLWVQPSGRVLIRGVREPVGRVLRLPLFPAERVVAVRGSLVLTSLRWIRVGKPESGRLPPVSGRPVLVWGGGVPEIVTAGRVYRPVPAKKRDFGGGGAPDLAELYAAAVRAQGLALPAQSPGLAGWLPKVKVSVFGRQTRKVRWHEEGAWDFSSGRYAGVFVLLTWSLQRTIVDGAENAREKLRAYIEQERWRLKERLAVLLAALKAHRRCGDQQALLEIRARIDMLTTEAAR
jgi:hypothetical protein